VLRIASWNVNGIRSAHRKGLLEWIASYSPDVLCLQETKAQPEQLTKELLTPMDGEGRPYRVFWASAKRKGYSGVALLSRSEPESVFLLGVPEFDDEGRVLCATFGDLTIVSAYFPNSQEAGARLDYKLRFCHSIRELCDRVIARKGHIVVSGDYNIAHTPIDLARPRENEENPGYLPEERAWMDEFTASGYVDTFRTLHPGQKNQYSWWSYRGRARENNVGWRIDYHCTDPGLLSRIADASILPDVSGSDHCPIILELKE
jgi:exodeoxyribonuclease III